MVTPEHALAIQQLAASFKLGVPHPLKAIQRMLVLMAFFGTSVSPASVLAETSSSSTRLASRKPPHHGEPGLRCSSCPLEGLSMEGMGRASGHGLQKEDDLDRCLQLRLGGAV